MGFEVILSAQAGRDLESIVRFLARRNPAAAEVTWYFVGRLQGGER
jgi:plasmid stabilization system protein ParE